MSTDLKLIMERHRLMRDMISDPDLTGDALVFALALIEVLTRKKESGLKERKGWYSETVELAFGTGRFALSTAKNMIREDRPRYEVKTPTWDEHKCIAQMIRREGICGKRPTHTWCEVVPETGERIYVGYCTRHYNPAHQIAHQQQFARWRELGEPRPAVNTGGVLARYFQGLTMTEMYTWAANGKEPEVGVVPATMPKPVLRIVRGEA